MKRFRQSLRLVLHEPTLFYGYRWLAWGLAALALVWPESSMADPAFHVWLWVLVAVFNLLAAALASSYIRIARLRPFILGLDIIASVALVWVSGGFLLPFFPYALGALVVPTLLFGWRGGLFASMIFVTLDQVALWTANRQIADWHVGIPDAVLRAIVPVVFVFALRWMVSLVQRATANGRVSIPDRPGRALLPVADRPRGTPSVGRSPRFVSPPATLSRPFEPAATDTSVVAPFAPIRASDPKMDEWRRTLIALTPNTTAELSVALDLLASGFEKRSAIEVRTTVVGRARTVSRAQYVTVLRLAQEALLNVQQHAHANHVMMALRFDMLGLALTVEDDGVGLLDGTYERPGVHALRMLAYRFAEIDGTLEVGEGALGGVRVRGVVPLSKAS